MFVQSIFHSPRKYILAEENTSSRCAATREIILKSTIPNRQLCINAQISVMPFQLDFDFS
jgi:hypothetical protein